MAKGHVRLGATTATLREYIIDIDRYRKVRVNPATVALNTGGDRYDDLRPWTFHVEQDWQAGVGRKGADDGGFLFSTAETRVPNQIILPQRVLQSDTRTVNGNADDARNLGRVACAGTVTVGPAATYRKLRWRVDIPNYTAGIPWLRLAVLLSAPAGTTVTFNAYTTATGSTKHATDWPSAVTISEDHPGYRWVETESSQQLSDPASAWIEITSNAAITLPVTAQYTDAEMQYYNGTDWVAIAAGTAHLPVFTTNAHGLAPNVISAGAIARFNGTLYAGHSTGLFKYTSASNTWAQVGSAAAQEITDLCVFGSVLYVGQASGNCYTCTTADTFAATAYPAVFFAQWNGFLYRTTGVSLYYSADASTWTGPLTVGHSGSAITGLSGAYDTVYVATTEGLYYQAPGNVMRGITRWGSIRSTNGSQLTYHQGALYAIVDGGVAQIQVGGGQANVLPIWANRDDDLVAHYLTYPTLLASTNNWLVVLTQSDSPATLNSLISTTSTAWIWTGQGWHFLGQMPMSRAYALYYDVTTSAVWIETLHNIWYAFRFPDYTLNPLNDSTSYYFPTGWLETPWIDGGMADVEKDFESVLISGEELASGQTVAVYYKVRGGSWTSLGTVDADGEELRWSDYSTRPAVKEIKLGFRLFSTSLTATPSIDAIRLKFRANVPDRWQWLLIIPMHDDQEMIDGTLNSYTGAQIKAHLEGLVAQTPPFKLEDVDGTEYEVYAAGYDLNVEKFEYFNSAKQTWWIAQVTLEQSYAP